MQSEDESFRVSAAPKDTIAADLTRMEVEEDDDNDTEAEEAMRSAEQTVKAVPSTSAPAADVDKELHSFEIDASQVGGQVPRTRNKHLSFLDSLSPSSPPY